MASSIHAARSPFVPLPRDLDQPWSRQRFRVAAVALWLLAATAACGGARPSPATPQTRGMTSEVNDTAATGKVPFTAVLFPYIPDSAGDNFASLISYLESNFEQANPEVDLTVVINADLDLYDYSANGTLSKLLGSGPEAAQVVEVDTVLMATLVGNKWVQPVQMTNPGVVATAWEAATLQGVVYGIPTYLCSNVVYAFSSVIKGAANATNLLALLTSIAPNVTPLVGQYKGCLLYTSPSPRDGLLSRMPSSA